MYPIINTGKAKQASVKFTNRNNTCLGMDKGKGSMKPPINNNGIIQRQYLGVQYPYPKKSLIMTVPSSMSLEQQNLSPLAVYHPSNNTHFTMVPPIVHEVVQRVADFFYENNIDPNIVDSVTFRKLMNDVGRGSLYQSGVLTVRELSWRVLDRMYCNLRSRVNYLKDTFWQYIGCTIILDGWDGTIKSTKFVNVVVDCPLGTVYLRSLDVTYMINDVEAMVRVVEGVLEEVGHYNVLQIISYSESPWLKVVGERIQAKYQWIFWSISVTYCLTMMLERMASSLGWVRDTIEQAKMVTRLINKDSRILKLFNKGNIQEDKEYYLVKPSKIKIVTPFRTLENMLLRKNDLRALFTSREWRRSTLGSTLKGKEIANMVVNDKTFWSRVAHVVKGGMPIVDVLCLMNGGKVDGVKNDRKKNNNENYEGNELQMGLLYEKIDQMKEEIRDNDIGIEETEEIWDIIDDIWNQDLHSPLHAAGYYLNPMFSYKENLVGDFEVISGIMTTILKIGGDQQTQSLITQHLDIYRAAVKDFEKWKKEQVKEKEKFSLVDWWGQFREKYPKLYGFALIVLGLTCNGVSSVELEREYAEKLHSTSKTDPSYEWLMKKSFVSYNIRLNEVKTIGYKYDIAASEFGPFDDWFVGE